MSKNNKHTNGNNNDLNEYIDEYIDKNLNENNDYNRNNNNFGDDDDDKDSENNQNLDSANSVDFEQTNFKNLIKEVENIEEIENTNFVNKNTNEDYINIIKECEGLESNYAASIFYHMLENSGILEKYIEKYSHNYRNSSSENDLSQLEKIAEKEENKHRELKNLFLSKTDTISEYGLFESILVVLSGVLSKKMRMNYEEKLSFKYENQLRRKRVGYLEKLKDQVTEQERILKGMSIDYRSKIKENFVNLKKGIKEYKLYTESIKKVHLKNEEHIKKGIISDLDEDLRNWEGKREELATDIKLYHTKNNYLDSRLSRIKMKRDHFSNVKNKLYYNINWIMYRIKEEEKRISLKDLVKNIKELEEIVNLNSLFDKTESEFIKEYEKMPNKDFLVEYNSNIESKNMYENYKDKKSKNIRDAEKIIGDFESKYGGV